MLFDKERFNLRFRDNPNMKTLVVLIFILLNSVKVSIFNYILLEDKKLITFGYKLVVTIIILSIVYSVLFQAKKRVVWVVFYAVQVIYIGGFICYYDYFNSIFHLFQMATLFPEGAAVVKHFSVPFYSNMLVAILDLPLFIWMMFHYDKVRLSNSIKKYKRYIVIGLLFMLSMVELVNFTRKTSLIAYAKEYPKRENQLVEKYGTFINSIYDYYFNADGIGLLNLYEYGEDIVGTQTKDVPTNIVIIQVESLDSNVINQKYKGKLIAPNLTKYAKENIYHKYTMSYHLAGGSSDAEYSTINSVEALTSFPSMKLNSDPYSNSIAKILVSNGYSANAFHGNIGSFYNRDKAYDLMGFNKFYDIDAMAMTSAKWGASDEDVFNYARKNIETQKEPFFNYIITMTSHTPFNFVDDYANIDEYDEIEQEDTKQYYKSINYTDKQVGSFVDSILTSYPNTCIVIFGDHTPGDLKEYEKASYILNNEYFEFVPLIIITPEKINYTNTKYAASFLDVAPTVLEESGIGYTIKSKGESLLSGLKPKSLIPLRGKNYRRSELILK